MFKSKKEYPSCVVNGYANMSDDETPSIPRYQRWCLWPRKLTIYLASSYTVIDSWWNTLIKQVCIYVFLAEELNMFRLLGSKGAIERHEDIEILRFLESGKTVKMVKCSKNHCR